MPSAPATSVVRWPVLVMIAVPALGAALAITFAADHSARYGLIVLGAFGLGTAIACAIAAVLLRGGLRTRLLVRAGVAAVLGAFSLIALTWAVGPSVSAVASAAALSWITALGLLALAVVDLATWRHLRGRDRTARDWLASAIILGVGAIAPLLVPANYLLPYVVRDKDLVLPLELTASIIMVGLIGAVFAILGVHLVIAGLSLLPNRQPTSTGEATREVLTQA